MNTQTKLQNRAHKDRPVCEEFSIHTDLHNLADGNVGTRQPTPAQQSKTKRSSRKRSFYSCQAGPRLCDSSKKRERESENRHNKKQAKHLMLKELLGQIYVLNINLSCTCVVYIFSTVWGYKTSHNRKQVRRVSSGAPAFISNVLKGWGSTEEDLKSG